MRIEDVRCCCEKGEEIRDNISDYSLEESEYGEDVDGPYIEFCEIESGYGLRIYCAEHSPSKVV